MRGRDLPPQGSEMIKLSQSQQTISDAPRMMPEHAADGMDGESFTQVRGSSPWIWDFGVVLLLVSGYGARREVRPIHPAVAHRKGSNCGERDNRMDAWNNPWKGVGELFPNPLALIDVTARQDVILGVVSCFGMWSSLQGGMRDAACEQWSRGEPGSAPASWGELAMIRVRNCFGFEGSVWC